MASRYPPRRGPPRGEYRGGRAGSRHGEHTHHGTGRVWASEKSKSESHMGKPRGGTASDRTEHKHQGATPHRGAHPPG